MGVLGTVITKNSRNKNLMISKATYQRFNFCLLSTHTTPQRERLEELNSIINGVDSKKFIPWRYYWDNRSQSFQK